MKIRLPIKKFFTDNSVAFISGALGFLLGFCLIFIFMLRGYHTQILKKGLASNIERLNEIDLDIAYSDIDFGSVPGLDLVTVKDFSIYALNGSWKLSFPEIRVYQPWLSTHKLLFSLGTQQEFNLGGTVYPVNGDEAVLELTLGENHQPQMLLAQLKNLSVKNFAKIGQINIASRRLNQNLPADSFLPSLENFFEINNVKIDGLINYPLTSHINRIYAKTLFMGQLEGSSDLLMDIHNWLGKGGYIDIPTFTINWKPLLMVGRGQLSFTEKLKPVLRLETSSKGMLTLIDDFQNKNFIDSKGAFVVKILLSNKAFKLRQDDEQLTVVTPIDYRDEKLAVENFTLKTFKP